MNYTEAKNNYCPTIQETILQINKKRIPRVFGFDWSLNIDSICPILNLTIMDANDKEKRYTQEAIILSVNTINKDGISVLVFDLDVLRDTEGKCHPDFEQFYKN